MSYTLTGRRRFRVEGELVVLQVEEVWGKGMQWDRERRWRDATIGDVTTHVVTDQSAHYEIPREVSIP